MSLPAVKTSRFRPDAKMTPRTCAQKDIKLKRVPLNLCVDVCALERGRAGEGGCVDGW